MKKAMVSVFSLVLALIVLFSFCMSAYAATLVCTYINQSCSATYFTGQFTISSGVCKDSHTLTLSSSATSTSMTVTLYNSSYTSMGDRVVTGVKGSSSNSTLTWTGLPSGRYYVACYYNGSPAATITGYVYDGN